LTVRRSREILCQNRKFLFFQAFAILYYDQLAGGKDRESIQSVIQFSSFYLIAIHDDNIGFEILLHRGTNAVRNAVYKPLVGSFQQKIGTQNNRFGIEVKGGYSNSGHIR